MGKNILLHGSLIAVMFIFGCRSILFAQSETKYVRVVNIVVNPEYLDSFKAALKEDIEASIPSEPGTLTLHAVYDKNSPSHVTVFEIYASKEAHVLHQQTPRFKKYKDATKNMTETTERFEMLPIALRTKAIQDSNHINNK